MLNEEQISRFGNNQNPGALDGFLCHLSNLTNDSVTCTVNNTMFPVDLGVAVADFVKTLALVA